MIMSTLIQQSEFKTPQSNFTFIQRLKHIVHEQLKKSTIIYTITNQSTTFHYYTTLDPATSPYIQLYWQIDYQPQNVSISVTFTTYRTLTIPIAINDLRNKIQLTFLLKLLNKNSPFFMTYLLNSTNQVSIQFSRSVFHQSDRTFLLKNIKSIVCQILQKARQDFESLVSYLTIPIEIYSKSFSTQKHTFQESQQFNLIKLKNTFDRFRKNRQRTADLIYEETDMLKMKKKIGGYAKILGFELRALENLKYTTKEIQRQKLLEQISSKTTPSILTKVDRIAYQFQIISVVEPQKKSQINANSQIYFGEYSFRIFKTLIQDDKISRSQLFNKTTWIQFEQKDVIQQRKCSLVKKKAINKVSQKALRNQTSFLKFMRNQICLYIANYFLPLDNSWNEVYLEKYDKSLLQVINSTKIYSFVTRLEIMLKILEGLKFITDSNICHRDIKPSNIMMNKQNDPKIIDFGSTISVHNQKVLMSCNQQLCATEGYHFPYENCNEKIKEMFTKKQYEAHPLFDIYSFGVMMEKIFQNEVAEKAKNEAIRDTLKFIILRCKEHNPDNRLSYDETLCLLLVLKKTLRSSNQNKAVEEL